MAAALRDSGVSWFYTWGADSKGVSAPGVEFVPMIWGAANADAATIARAKAAGRTLLGFNEPDLAGQAEMSVDTALSLWPKLQATGLRLGAPAVAAGADKAGGWLDEFMTGAAARGYRVDFIPLHWYGGDFRAGPATDQLEAYVSAVWARYHKPIWITEYALMRVRRRHQVPHRSRAVGVRRPVDGDAAHPPVRRAVCLVLAGHPGRGWRRHRPLPPGRHPHPGRRRVPGGELGNAPTGRTVPKVIAHATTSRSESACSSGCSRSAT